jgi:hypothetical protein
MPKIPFKIIFWKAPKESWNNSPSCKIFFLKINEYKKNNKKNIKIINIVISLFAKNKNTKRKKININSVYKICVEIRKVLNYTFSQIQNIFN